MYGRLVEIEGVDPSKREEVLGILRERIIPGLELRLPPLEEVPLGAPE
jgi:hypothetical protein